jgi:hypothetical protein
MATTDTLRRLPISVEDFTRLEVAARDRAPHLRLDLDHTDTGEPFVSVMGPTAWEAVATIIRSEHGELCRKLGDEG